jgi:hypothetical protein
MNEKLVYCSKIIEDKSAYIANYFEIKTKNEKCFDTWHGGQTGADLHVNLLTGGIRPHAEHADVTRD